MSLEIIKQGQSWSKKHTFKQIRVRRLKSSKKKRERFENKKCLINAKWSNETVKERRGLKGLTYTKKRRRQRVLAVDLATCSLIEKVWWDVTSVHCSDPVTQCHVGCHRRSLSLFAETSYSSSLGGLCTDQDLGHRRQRKTSDIGHRWSDSNGGPRKLGPTNTMS